MNTGWRPRSLKRLLPKGDTTPQLPFPAPRQQAELVDLGTVLNYPRGHNEARIRALCHNAYLGGGTAICRVLGRYKMFVDTRDVGLSPHLLLDGYWEMWVTEAMLGLLREGMVAVDVGANLGYFTLVMADRCGASGRVHAFEPNPQMVARLRQTLEVNGFGPRTVVHPVPLSDRDGAVVELVVPDGEPKNGYIVPRPDGAQDAMLKTRRLDTVKGLDRVDFIKVDAEGAEEGIWRGMEGVLRQGGPLTVILEYTRDRYSDPEGFLRDMLSHGFSLSVIDPWAGIRPVAVAEVLSGPANADWMLVLRR